MRGKRAKQYRKAMQAYAMTFNFREPYQILVDADMIKDAARFKMKLGGMLERTVHGEIKPMITQCCIRHLYDAEVEPGQKGEKEQWIEVAKQAERRKCGHHELDEPLSALECLQSVVDPKRSGTNKHRYVVASQDREVRAAMRQVAGVPLIYINRSVMILEPLAAKTEARRNADEISKRKAGLRGRNTLAAGEKRKRDDDDEHSPEEVKRKKVKGPKGPNPLSVKKSKKTVAAVPKQKTETADVAARPASTEHSSEHDDAQVQDEPADGANEQTPKRKRKRKKKTAPDEEAVADGGSGDEGES